MSGLQNALSKLSMLYNKKKDQLNDDQVKKAEQIEEVKAVVVAPAPQKEKKLEKVKKKLNVIMRKCAGDVWEDPTLGDWPENDYRLFCGNLGNEVSDELLSGAFRKYQSFARARVIRDKKNMKTRGYGFVSFLNPNDYLRAYKEMNGKYIGNRPVLITKSKWQDRSLQKKKNDGLNGKFIKQKQRKLKKIQPPQN